MKSQTVFICSNCQFKTPKWQGKCPNCGEWNTLEKSQVASSKISTSGVSVKPVELSSVNLETRQRIATGISEFDEVLGGGVVPGSLVLLGGDPGIGKSTLALQISLGLKNQKVLYVSGEESAAQIKLRAVRVDKNLDLPVLADTNLSSALDTVSLQKPNLVILDSIQTLYSEEATGVAGGVAQVTNAIQQIMGLAKREHIAFLVIGHVTKEGYLAGPKTLEHMVDTVLYLEGERLI
jgi:DNA repair protein RadA/Sms